MKHLKFLFLIIGLTILASCSDSDVEGGLASDKNPAAFSGVIGKLQTRVTGDSWNDGDAIGIYALKADQALSAGAIFDGKSNVKYTTTGNGAFTPAAAPINFPESGNLDFVAYYPFQNMSIDFVYNIDVSTQSSPAAIDLLYSSNAKGKNKAQPNVDLKFKHMLSKLVFEVTLEENMSMSNGFNVSVKDMVVDGLFDLINGKVAIGKAKKMLSPVINISSDNKSATVTAIVVPGQNLKDVTIEFTLDGKNYEWIPYSQELVSSTKYSYALKLVIDDSGLPTVVPLKVGATIEEWLEGNTGDGEVILTPTEEDDPIVDDEFKTIDDIRTMYADSGQDEWTIAEPLQIKAVVISDRVGGNSTSLKNGYIQDQSGEGLGFRTTLDHEFNLGEELIIDLQGAIISKYGGAVQLGFANEKAEINATDVAITPKEVTIEEILAGGHDATLVKIKNVQFKEYKDLTYFEGEFSAHNRTLGNKEGKTIDARTAKYATFKDNILPKGSGNIVGVMTVFNGSWQLYIRNLDDISEMSNDESTRFSDEGDTDPDPDPDPNPDSELLFPGSNFNNWTTFTNSLNSFGVTFGKESKTGGIEGSGAMQFEGQHDKNAYVFTATVPEGFTATNKTKITFKVKGTAVKSLSMNVYVGTGGAMGTDYKCYNMDEHAPYTTHKVLNPTDANSYANGGINTSGEWVQVTLDISSIAGQINSTPGEDLFALKIGKNADYDLFVDDIAID